MRHARTTIAAAAAAALLAGLTAATVALVRRDTTPPTTEPSPAVHATLSHAGRYLAIVAPAVETRDRCLWAESVLEEEKSVVVLAEVKDCLADYAATSRTVAGELRAVSWPADVAADVERLAAVYAARSDVLTRAAKVRTVGEYWRHRLPDDDGPAAVVRARLGLVPSCRTEDSHDCVWDAGRRGNGEGRSFVDVAGTPHYLP